jgi:hypothetical protein
MDAFEYLAVLISIILGLGIAQLLGGFGRWVEHRDAFRPFAPALIWAGILLLIHIQTWWSMFGLRFVTQWTFVRFAVVLLRPIVLYLLAVLVLPSQSTTTTDLRANYFAQRRWFFGLLAFLLVVSLSKDLVLSGSLPNAVNVGFHAAFLAASIVALGTQREAYHQAAAAATTIACVLVGAPLGTVLARTQFPFARLARTFRERHDNFAANDRRSRCPEPRGDHDLRPDRLLGRAHVRSTGGSGDFDGLPGSRAVATHECR